MADGAQLPGWSERPIEGSPVARLIAKLYDLEAYGPDWVKAWLCPPWARYTPTMIAVLPFSRDRILLEAKGHLEEFGVKLPNPKLDSDKRIIQDATKRAAEWAGKRVRA